VDKQAAARCWRDGQRKRCFTYRFLATGTVEEKIFQRQLSKEGLQSVVDDKAQVNTLSTKDLRNLFKLRSGTPSDTHDKLRCERCKIIQDNAELEALKVLPKTLAACLELVNQMMEHEDSVDYHKPLISQDHGVTKEDYEKLVKQPMDLGTIRSRLGMLQDQPSAYKSVSGVSKDVNRIFSNVMKVWSPGDPIADAARKLQSWWVEQWTELVPRLMTMKADTDEKTDSKSTDLVCDVLESCATLQNERGEDYQEQIGMPDEENMRSWSHHHTTDTVDDPIFRAAMRGYDAVSFIFGLEVTWSLIQERQQEEEERLAMEAMEAIQELQGEEDDEGKAAEEGSAEVEAVVPINESSSSDDDNGGDSDGGEAAVANQDDGEDLADTPTNDSLSSDDDNGGDSDGGEAAVANQDDGEDLADTPMNDSLSSDDNNDDDGDSDTGEAALTNADVEEDVADDADDSDSDVATLEAEVVDSSAASREMEVSGPEEESELETTDSSGSDSSQQEKENLTPSPVSDQWPCPKCTLINAKSARKCTVCDTKKPRAGNKRSITELS
jgi:hypothetical protein